MKLDKKVIERVNDLKIFKTTLKELTYNDIEESLKLIREKVTYDSFEEAEKLFLEALSTNPETKILHLFIAIIKFHFNQGDQLSAEDFLEKFIVDLKKHNKADLIIQTCELLSRYYSSLFLLEYMAQSLKQKLKQSGYNSQNEPIRQKLLSLLIKIHHHRVDNNKNTEIIADLICQSPQPEDWREALFYYQVVFENLIKDHNGQDALRLWKKIIQSKAILELLNSQEGFDKFTYILNHITSVGDEKIKQEIFRLAITLKVTNKIENLSRIFKMALRSNIFLGESFNLLGDKWYQLYQFHPGYYLFLKLSGIKKSFTQSENGKNINCQKIYKEIEEFEKLITLQKNTLIIHRNFGIGIIKEINLTSKQADESNIFFTIDFEEKKKHSMSLRIARNSLEIAYPYHLRGIKSFFPEKLTEILNSNNDILFKHILLSLNEPVSIKQIKTFMVPDILDENSWKARWKTIKTEISNFNFVRSKNNFFYYDEHTSANQVSENNSFTTVYPKLDTINDKLSYISESLHQHNRTELIPIKTEVEKLLNEFKEAPQQNNEINEYFPALLAIAQRIDCPIDEQIWDKGKSLLKIASNFPNSTQQIPGIQILAQSLNLIPQAATRIEFIKNFKYLTSPEDRVLLGASLFNIVSGVFKESIFEYWRQHFGEDSLKKIFEVIDKEYLTSIDTFILLAKFDIDKKVKIYPGDRTQFYTKLIRALHESHLNMKMDKDRGGSKKNFNTLYRILFEEEHLFNHLKNDPKICPKDRIAILQKLEQKSYLDNKIKREVRALHTSFGHLDAHS